MTFYNTLHLTSSSLAHQERKAKTQEAVILEFFKEHPDKAYTPFEVHKELFTDMTPPTSVRRAISYLEKKGFLEKTGMHKTEKYGLPNNCWQFKPKNYNQTSFA